MVPFLLGNQVKLCFNHLNPGAWINGAGCVRCSCLPRRSFGAILVRKKSQQSCPVLTTVITLRECIFETGGFEALSTLEQALEMRCSTLSYHAPIQRTRTPTPVELSWPLRPKHNLDFSNPTVSEPYFRIVCLQYGKYGR